MRQRLPRAPAQRQRGGERGVLFAVEAADLEQRLVGGLFDFAAGVVQLVAGGGGDGEVAGEAVVAVAGDELTFAGEQRLVFLLAAGGGDLAAFSRSASSASSAVRAAWTSRAALRGLTGSMTTETVRLTVVCSSSGVRKSASTSIRGHSEIQYVACQASSVR